MADAELRTLERRGELLRVSVALLRANLCPCCWRPGLVLPRFPGELLCARLTPRPGGALTAAWSITERGSTLTRLAILTEGDCADG